MTIQSTVGKVTVNGNGSATSFSFGPMVIFADTDLTVTFIDTNGVETLIAEGTGATNYAVVVGSYPGTGSITYPASGGTKLAVGQQLVMARSLPLTQLNAMSTQGPYDPTLQETSFDRLTVIAQQQQEQLARSLTLPIGVSGVSTQLPVPVANTLIAWAADALSLINVGIAAIGSTSASAYALTLLVLSTAAAWRTALGSTTVGDAVFTAASAAAARTTLGLGTAAVANTGTSGANVPLLNAANTHSALLTATAGLTVTTNGIQSGAPTGGDKGAGTGNFAAGVYDNGARLTASKFTLEYISAQQAITAGGALTLAHGLGAVPKFTVVSLHNVTTDAGYTTGQEFDAPMFYDDGGAARGLSIIKDATNLTVRFASPANTYQVPHASTGTATAITDANWTLIVKAWA